MGELDFLQNHQLINHYKEEVLMRQAKKQDLALLANHRATIYGFLAAIYRQEVSSGLLKQIKDPQFLEVLSSLGIELNNGFFKKPEKELIEDLAVEYAHLFLGPGKHISPHESVHHKKENAPSGQLWGESTAEVKKIIESSGLEYQPEYTGLPDHISVELEFMQHVVLREEQAWEAEDKEMAHLCLENEKKFIEEHLARWVPNFCEKVTQEADLPFYREMARLTQTFIEFEKQELNKLKEDTPKK
jgi:TorA maturation chaperone TorD